jgi:hypothetical protein
VRYLQVASTVVQASIYPDSVDLASLLASDFWRSMALSGRPDDLDRFCLEAGRRLGQNLEIRRFHDPLNQWIEHQLRANRLAALQIPRDKAARLGS